MEAEIRKRLHWIQLYEKIGNASIVCRKCGISRPTLRKWLKRYKLLCIEGLTDESRRPDSFPFAKVRPEHEAMILALRKSRKLGHQRIAHELKRLHDLSLSVTTIHKVLARHNEQYLHLKRHYRKKFCRYSRPVPSDRIQLDVCKIAPGKYQYTAIDDCSRYLVVAIFKRRTATNTLMFLEQILEEMPFPIQRIQTDRGTEFFAETFQKELMTLAIKFRPIKPASPHLNGKVERAQKTVVDEFYSTADINASDLDQELSFWQHYDNWHRPHGSLGGKTPIDVVCELFPKTPYSYEVAERYDQSKERIQLREYLAKALCAFLAWSSVKRFSVAKPSGNSGKP